MLSWYNRNITQTEICLHNTFYLNRIFTREMKKKKSQKNCYHLQCLDWILPFCVHVGRCSTSFLFCRAFLQGLDSKGTRSLRSHPILEDGHRGHHLFPLSLCQNPSATLPPGIQLPVLKARADRAPQAAVRRGVRSRGLAPLASELHLTQAIGPWSLPELRCSHARDWQRTPLVGTLTHGLDFLPWAQIHC